MKVKRPTTIHDNGDPTDNLLFDAKRVLRLVEDERHLSAEALYQNIRKRIQNDVHNAAYSKSNEACRALKKQNHPMRRKRAMLKQQKNSEKTFNERKEMTLELLAEHKDMLKKLENRCRLFKRAKKNINMNDDWALAQTLFGVTTYYRHESDGGVSIKLEGRVSDCSLFDQVAVMREFDLNYLWAPFVTSSMTVTQLDKLDIVGWFLIGLPHFGVMRDALFRAIGCDSIYEDGSVLIVAHGIADRPRGHEDDGDKGESITLNADGKFGDKNLKVDDFKKQYKHMTDVLRKDSILDTLDLPPIPTRMGGGRITIRSLAAQIHLESPTSATTTLVANIDPNIHLIPQYLIDFVLKRMCSTILCKMKCAAKNISKNPITNLHAIKIREEEDFYKTFLLPKFEGICKIRGWQMPIISALNLSDAQLESAENFKAKRRQNSEIKALGVNNMDSDLNEYLQSSTSHCICNDEVDGASEQASEDGPKGRTLCRSLDDMSDISKSSSVSFLWRSNPILRYKRQIEERAQLRKHRDIQESRERATERLRPKSLNEEAILRLKELRDAQNLHFSRKESIGLEKNICEPPPGMNRSLRCWSVSLSYHGLFTKIFVLQFFIASLFCLLYLDVVFNKVVAVRGSTFSIERGRDFATLTYILVAGVVHFAFCYTALIYAFSTLQLGSIAGKRTRSFYGQNVLCVVAITSASIVGLGLIKPGIDRFLRWIVWNAYSTLVFAKVRLRMKISGNILTTIQTILNAAFTVILSTQKLFLQSKILGCCIILLKRIWLVAIMKCISYPVSTYIETTIKQYEGDSYVLPWRQDAFFTTRALLSHSACFLLILLLLFNFAAKKARKTIHVNNNAELPSFKHIIQW